MPDVLQDTFDIEINQVTDKDGQTVTPGDTFKFKIPTIKFDIEVSYRAADVRRRAYPDSQGQYAVDMASIAFSRSCAILEMYLVSSTVVWPYGINDGQTLDPSKQPAVDFEKFPVQYTDDVYKIGEAFEQAVTRFRTRGNTNQGSATA